MRNPPIRGRNRRIHRKVLLCLLVCYPYGLFQMWRKARWPLLLKGTITAAFAALTLLILLPQTAPPAQGRGGVELVGAQPKVEVFGPELPAALDNRYISYTTTSSGGSVLADVEEFVETYVYLNERGKYYHASDCQYVAWYSVKMTPAVAHFSGYLPCPVCGVEAYMPG